MEKTVVIKNATGLHARPAGMFVKKASEFTSTVEVLAKAIMGIMSLGLGQGEEIVVKAEGADDAAAVDALVELIESGFGE